MIIAEVKKWRKIKKKLKSCLPFVEKRWVVRAERGVRPTRTSRRPERGLQATRSGCGLGETGRVSNASKTLLTALACKSVQAKEIGYLRKKGKK